MKRACGMEPKPEPDPRPATMPAHAPDVDSVGPAKVTRRNTRNMESTQNTHREIKQRVHSIYMYDQYVWAWQLVVLKLRGKTNKLS